MPKIYAVLLEQEGEGCDYTIGCGKNWEFFPASSVEEAYKKAKTIAMGGEDSDEECYYFNSERTLKLMMLVEVINTLPCGQWRKEVVDRQEEKVKRSQENAEKKELDRLKKKYG